MIHAGMELARRLENAAAALARAGADAQRGSVSIEVAGGCAVFAGADSPLTQAVGVGIEGPVTEAEIGTLEAFFRLRGAPVSIELCPFADPQLIDSLATRGCRLREFTNVLIRPAGSGPAESPCVRLVPPEESELWARTVGLGFSEQPRLTEAEMNVGRTLFATAGTSCYLAFTESGEAAAGGALAIIDGVAVFFADSTIARFRGRGLQSQIIAARLSAAAGCDLAVASTLPGSISQRNYERAGFRVAYTRVLMVG